MPANKLFKFPYDAFLMIRFEFLAICQDELEAKLLRIIEMHVDEKRKCLFADIVNSSNEKISPDQVVEVETDIWVPISHRLFMNDLYGTVTSENTIKKAIKSLISKKMILMRYNPKKRYDAPEYRLYTPVIQSLLDVVGKPGYQKLIPSVIDTIKKSPPQNLTLSGCQELILSCQSRVSKVDTNIINITDNNSNNKDTYGDDANAHHATAFILRHDFNGRSFYYHDLCNQQQDRGCNEGMTFTIMRLENVPQDAQCDICYQPIHAQQTNVHIAQDATGNTPLENNETHSHSQEEPNGYTMGDAAHLSAHGRGTAGLHRSDGDVAGEHPQTNSRHATSSVRPASQSDTALRGSGHEGDASVQEVSHDALTLSPGQAQPTTGRGAADMVGEAQETGVGLPDAPVTHQGRAQTTPSLSVGNPIAVGGNSKAVEQDKKPTRTSKKVVAPSGPPQMPSDDAPWNAETVVQIFEARLGRRYPNGAKRAADRVRDKELAASIELVNMVDLWDASTKENKYRLLKIADHHENRKEQWFLDNVGRVMPHHLLKDDYIHRDVDELVRLKKSKQGSAHSVSGRHNYTYEKDLPKEEAPLPYKIVPQQSPRKLDLELKDDEQPRRRLRLHRVTPLAAAQPGV